jgi:hypothetical protein
VLARIRLALASGAPQGARVLTEAQLRVLWPGGGPTDRDTARRTLARAVEDVTRRLGGP